MGVRLLPSPLKAMQTPHQEFSLQHRPCCSVLLFAKRESSAHQEKPLPRHQPLKEVPGPRPPSAQKQSLAVSCTRPPPANNMHFMYGDTSYTEEISWASASSWGQKRRGGSGALAQAWPPAWDLPLGPRHLWKDVAGGGTLRDHWNILGCGPPG